MLFMNLTKIMLKNFRFTMLLLDPGEIFFEDYSAQMSLIELAGETKKCQWIEGRLKLCSKSLVFVSPDFCFPLTKILLKETVSIDINK